MANIGEARGGYRQAGSYMEEAANRLDTAASQSDRGVGIAAGIADDIGKLISRVELLRSDPGVGQERSIEKVKSFLEGGIRRVDSAVASVGYVERKDAQTQSVVDQVRSLPGELLDPSSMHVVVDLVDDALEALRSAEGVADEIAGNMASRGSLIRDVQDEATRMAEAFATTEEGM